MTDFKDALDSIMDVTDSYAQILLNTNVINSYIYGSKYRDKIKLPLLQIAFDTVKPTIETMGSGSRETWQLPLMVGCTVKELENPRNGFLTAANIISQFRNLILEHPRNMTTPSIIRKVDSAGINLVPYAFSSPKIKGKNTLYGAGTTINVYFVIDNL